MTGSAVAPADGDLLRRGVVLVVVGQDETLVLHLGGGCAGGRLRALFGLRLGFGLALPFGGGGVQFDVLDQRLVTLEFEFEVAVELLVAEFLVVLAGRLRRAGLAGCGLLSGCLLGGRARLLRGLGRPVRRFTRRRGLLGRGRLLGGGLRGPALAAAGVSAPSDAASAPFSAALGAAAPFSAVFCSVVLWTVAVARLGDAAATARLRGLLSEAAASPTTATVTPCSRRARSTDLA